MGDWPENDQLTASCASNVTSLTVADGTQYSQGWLLQVDTEAFYVTANGTGTTVPVLRARRGTTAASHASASTILVRPHFLDTEYLLGINSGINATFPMLYQSVVDQSIFPTGGQTYEYTVPNLNSVPIQYISELSFKVTGDLAFRPFTAWDILRGSTPTIRLRRPLPNGNLRIYGFGPLPPLANLTDTLNSLFPLNAEDALTYYAAQYLLESGEARRVREDTGARDDREQANRVGASMAVSQSALQRFLMRIQQSAMPPMPKNVKSVI